MELLPLPTTIAHKSSCICSLYGLGLSNEGNLVKFSHCRLSLSLGKSQIRKPIITCAGNRKRQYGSSRSAKIVFESAYQIASRLKIVPEPLDFLIKMLGNGNGNGNGGGFWITKGSGWGGFDGWGRRRGKSKRKMAFLFVAVILGIGIWMILGKEFKTDVFLKVLGFMALGLTVFGWKTTRFRDWALGFSSCAVLVGLAMKKEDFQKLIKKNNIGSLKLKFRQRKRKPF